MDAGGRGVLAEALVSWLSLYGVLSALLVYWKQAARTRLELCAAFLLECLAALLLVRGFFWTTSLALFGILTFAVAALIPLAALLYVEALLRRHLGLATKVFVLAGTGLFLGLALVGRLHADRIGLPAFTLYLFVVQVVLAGAILFRDRADLTPIEDRAVAAVAVGVALIVPLVLTDLAADLGMPMVRVGSVGILILVHAIVVASEPRTRAGRLLVTHLGVIAAAAVLGLVQAYVMGDLRAATIARSGSMFACITLLVMIHTRVHALGPVPRGPGLLRSISGADTRTTEDFLHVLDRLPIVAGYRLLRAPDLASFDVAAFPAVFRALGERVVSHRRLQRTPRVGRGEALYHAEQLEALLEREAMTHAVLIRESPVALLLVLIPSAGTEHAAVAQLGLVRTIAEVIERGNANA